MHINLHIINESIFSELPLKSSIHRHSDRFSKCKNRSDKHEESPRVFGTTIHEEIPQK